MTCALAYKPVVFYQYYVPAGLGRNGECYEFYQYCVPTGLGRTNYCMYQCRRHVILVEHDILGELPICRSGASGV